MSFFENKTILVTGATGLVGYNLINNLMSRASVKIIALSRNEEKLKETFEIYKDNDNFSYISHDISMPLPITANIDIIFHAAGCISSEMIKNQPVDIICPNILGTKNCLDFIKKQKEETGINARLVLFSSTSLYGNLTNDNITVSEVDTDVSDKLHVTNAPYTESKRMAEVLATAYQRQYGVDVVIARISYVYGSAKSLPSTAFYDFIKQAAAGEKIVLNSSALPKRDNIYIDDVVTGILCICSKGECGEAYNVSSDGEYGNFAAIDELAMIIAEVANKLDAKKQVEVSYKNPHNSERSAGIIANNTKLKALGWGIRYSVHDGILNILNKYVPR